MFKKTMPMALAVVALAAGALPAYASAHWTHNGVTLGAGENATISFTGPADFESESGGFKCFVDGMATFVGGTTTGTIDSFTSDGSPTVACETTGLLKAFDCQVEKVMPTELPWTIHWNTTSSITITTGEIHVELPEPCPIDEIRVTPGTVAASASPMDTIEKLTLFGLLPSTIGDLGVSGQLGLVEGKGTFGI